MMVEEEHKTQYPWILGEPAQTDNTNFFWVGGEPYIVYEKAAPPTFIPQYVGVI